MTNADFIELLLWLDSAILLVLVGCLVHSALSNRRPLTRRGKRVKIRDRNLRQEVEVQRKGD